jgi:hypothetical protein
MAAALGIPPAGEYDVLLEVLPRGNGQRWVRRFGGHTLVETDQSEQQGLLLESSGPGCIGFELIISEGALFFRPRRAWLFRLRLPLWLAPRIEAENWPNEPGGWRVHVRFGVPCLGRVAEYEGIVTPEAEASPGTLSLAKGNDGAG